MKTTRLCLTPFLLWAGLAVAHAHAFLDHADPRVGATVSAPPPDVKIWFTEELEAAFSKIEVLDSAGHEIDRHDSKVDSANKALMSVSVPALPPGAYKVVWHAVALDTHHTMGSFSFTVKAP
jgi:methionine-rich copper-binding protein CopC